MCAQSDAASLHTQLWHVGTAQVLEQGTVGMQGLQKCHMGGTSALKPSLLHAAGLKREHVLAHTSPSEAFHAPKQATL
jgi:hypothetical protein